MNIPQVLGYARIAGCRRDQRTLHRASSTRRVRRFGSSRHLVVAADLPQLSHLLSTLSRMAVLGSEKYVALVGMVRSTAGILFLALIFKLGFLADFLSRTILGRVSHRCRVSGRDLYAGASKRVIAGGKLHTAPFATILPGHCDRGGRQPSARGAHWAPCPIGNARHGRERLCGAGNSRHASASWGQPDLRTSGPNGIDRDRVT